MLHSCFSKCSSQISEAVVNSHSNQYLRAITSDLWSIIPVLDIVWLLMRVVTTESQPKAGIKFNSPNPLQAEIGKQCKLLHQIQVYESQATWPVSFPVLNVDG